MSPNRHPKATHMGNAVEIASPISSIHFCKLGPPLVLLLFDEKPQRSGGSREACCVSGKRVVGLGNY
jgi:hypothetical protein